MSNKTDEIHKNPWPPDSLLKLIGLTREEWDEMADQIQRDKLLQSEAIVAALLKGAMRRAHERDKCL